MTEKRVLSCVLISIVMGIAYFLFADNIPWNNPYFVSFVVTALLACIFWALLNYMPKKTSIQAPLPVVRSISGSYKFDSLYISMMSYLNGEIEIEAIKVRAREDRSAYGPLYQLRYRQDWHDQELKKIVRNYQELMKSTTG